MLMKKYLLGGKGKFYKANLHLHTTVSDGKLTPQQAKEEYKKRGYSILAYADHEVLVPHHDLSDENFLAITACELAINENVENAPFPFLKTYHLNFYAKDKKAIICPFFNEDGIWLKNSLAYVAEEMKHIHYTRTYDTECINNILKKSKENGFLVTLNHPKWSQQSYPDYINLKGLWGIEVYNTHCARVGYLDTDMPYNDLLKKGNNIVPLATDDTHVIDGAFSGFTMIEADKLDYENILTAMEQGHIYSSNGPLINSISFENNKIFVSCSEASKIILNTERRWSRVAMGDKITYAEFDLTDYFSGNEVFIEKKSRYIRLTIIDNQGRMAWTRAYFVKRLGKGIYNLHK